MNLVRSLSRSVLALTGTVAASTSLLAQESPYELERTGWYIRTGAYLQMGMNVSVSRVNPPAPITPGIYDNGFVQEDISQGAMGLTWNWGYQEASQIANGQLELSRVEGLSTVNSLDGFGNGNLYGPEVVAGFEFYRFEIKRRDAHMGFEIALRYGNYSGSDQQTVQSDVLLKRDQYDLGGIVAPLPPYVGFPNVPGPLISLTPHPLPTLASRATSTLSTSLDADFYTARFGAWVLVPLSERWTAGISVGFTSIYAWGSASFTQTSTYDNPAFRPVTQSSNQSEGDWLPGAYIQLRSTYRILPWMKAYLGIEWATSGSLRIDGLDYQAQFDFGSTYGASGGLEFSF